MAPRRFYLIVSLIGLAVAPAGAGCGGDDCSEAPSSSPNAPVVTLFDLRGQLDGDPWTLIFEVAFEDEDGDLSAGRAEFFLNAERSDTSVALFDVFRQTGLEPDATRGKLGIPLRFADTVQDGASVRLGVQLVDEADHRSNCYSFDLAFSVEQL